MCETNSLDLFAQSTHFSFVFQGNGPTSTKWSSAKPFGTIPGPSQLTMLARFLPGGTNISFSSLYISSNSPDRLFVHFPHQFTRNPGKYHNIEWVDMRRSMNAEYGNLMKMPGPFGGKPILVAYEAPDFEHIFRSEGVWPKRRGMEILDHYRRTIRPDIFAKTGAGY